MKKYSYKDRYGKIHYVNIDLAHKQGLSNKDISNLIPIYQSIVSQEVIMATCNPIKEKNLLLELYQEWKKKNFELQAAWNFKKNANYFKEFTVPHCTCPKLDNEELVGLNRRIISSDCIYHGSKT